MTDRYSFIRGVADKASVDAVALVPGANFARLYDAEFHQNERPLLVIVPVDGLPRAVVPHLELDAFKRLNFEGEVFDWTDQQGYQPAFDALFQGWPINSVAVEGQAMRVFIEHALRSSRQGLEIVDMQHEISAVRICKTAREIEAIQHAVSITERALQNTIDKVRAGQSERHIEQMLVQELFTQGADGLAFSPVVAASTNSALPHAHSRSDYAIKAGDALLIDTGARANGLCGDLTRTFFINHYTDEQAAVYHTVLQANQAGHDAARPGVTAHEVDDVTTGVLEQSAFADRILHKTGHGLGREVHEEPYIMRGNHQHLEEGMVFTIEPGLYDVSDFGVRIEDDVLITAQGSRSLTCFDKTLTVIG